MHLLDLSLVRPILTEEDSPSVSDLITEGVLFYGHSFLSTASQLRVHLVTMLTLETNWLLAMFNELQPKHPLFAHNNFQLGLLGALGALVCVGLSWLVRVLQLSVGDDSNFCIHGADPFPES